MINSDFKLKKYNDPCPHIIISDFFEKVFYTKLEEDFPNSKRFKTNSVNRMHGDITYGDQLYSDLINSSAVYNKLHNWVYSKDFMNFFLNFFKDYFKSDDDFYQNLEKFDLHFEPLEIGKVFNLDNYESKNTKPLLFPRLDIGYGVKNYGINTGGKGPHIDNPQRVISILFYVGGYNIMEGGQHRLYKISNNNEKELEVSKIYEPKKNLLIASLQNNFAFHDVNPITHIEGQRNAFYMAISSNKRTWRPSKRNYINKKYNKNRVENTFLKKCFLNIKKISLNIFKIKLSNILN